MIPLFAFVALIPVEEALLVSGVGTLSRAWRWSSPCCTRSPARPVDPPGMPLAGWAFVEWAVLSTIWSINANVALAELSTLIQLFVIAVLVADVIVHDPGLVRALLWTYSISASFPLRSASSPSWREIEWRTTAPSPCRPDPAHFAALLLPAFIFCTFELLRGRRPYLSLPVVLITLAGILLSGTRGAWVSMVVVLALFVFPALKLRRKIGAVILLVVVSVAVLQIPRWANLVVDRVATAGASGGAGRTVHLVGGRGHLRDLARHRGGLRQLPGRLHPKMVREAGVGLSNQGDNRAPHNLASRSGRNWASSGLVLLGLFLVPLVVRRGWGPDAQVIRAILVAFMVDALFLDLFGNRKQVWLIIGIAVGLAFLARRAEIRG